MLNEFHFQLQNLRLLNVETTSHFRLKVPDVMPPWYETLKSVERSLRDAWMSNQKFRDSYIDNMIKDFLHAEVAGIVSSTITVIT